MKWKISPLLSWILMVVPFVGTACSVEMVDQEKQKANSGYNRPFPEGTVYRRAGRDWESPLEETFEESPRDLGRGQELFNIYCAVCHGSTGQGDGKVVQRGFPRPPPLDEPHLLDSPRSHFFNVITNGFGAMPAYATDIPFRDRWRIVTYLTELQKKKGQGR